MAELHRELMRFAADTADAALAPHEVVRLREAMRRGRSRSLRAWRFAGVLTAAGVAAAAVIALRPSPWAVAELGCVDVQTASVRSHCPNAAVVAVGPDRWTVEPGALLQREADGARLVTGHVRFAIEPRAPDEPRFTLAVSGGKITVLGTRFVVREDGRAGEVDVEHGRVSFTALDGRARVLGAGEHLRWPLEAAPAHAPEPELDPPGLDPEENEPSARERGPAAGPRTPTLDEAPGGAPADSSRPPLDAEALIARLVQLRSQRRYDEAAAALRAALADGRATPAQRERLDRELGDLLELYDVAAACAQWRAFVARYPASPRAAAVGERLQACPP